MHRRNLIKILAFSVLSTITLFSSSVQAADKPRVFKPKVLKVGETVSYTEDVSVTFLAVLRDARCPINAKCLNQGFAVVSLKVKAGKKPAKIMTLRTEGKNSTLVISPNDGSIGIPLSYYFSIKSLSPLPYAGKPTKQSDYRMKLNFAVAM